MKYIAAFKRACQLLLYEPDLFKYICVQCYIRIYVRSPSLLFTSVFRVNILYIESVYKRIVRFQKLIRNLFLTLHGHNIHRQQRKLSKFLMRYQQFASHA